MAIPVPEIAPQAKLDQCRTVRNTGDRCLPQRRAGGARHLRNPLTEYLQYQRDGHQLAIGSDLAWADNQLPAVGVGGPRFVGVDRTHVHIGDPSGERFRALTQQNPVC